MSEGSPVREVGLGEGGELRETVREVVESGGLFFVGGRGGDGEGVSGGSREKQRKTGQKRRDGRREKGANSPPVEPPAA